MTPTRTAVLAATGSVMAIVLAGCMGQPAPARTTGATPSASAAPVTSAPPEPTAPTCGSIIPEETVTDFASVGWSAQAEPFRIEGTIVEGGIECVWGNYSVASDHVQVFGWAPIGAEDAELAISRLVAQGWRASTSIDGSTDVTEGDEATGLGLGSGMTYRFGEGWVAVADTPEGVALIDGPTG